jgi:hypothetical protein
MGSGVVAAAAWWGDGSLAVTTAIFATLLTLWRASTVQGAISPMAAWVHAFQPMAAADYAAMRWRETVRGAIWFGGDLAVLHALPLWREGGADGFSWLWAVVFAGAQWIVGVSAAWWLATRAGRVSWALPAIVATGAAIVAVHLGFTRAAWWAAAEEVMQWTLPAAWLAQAYDWVRAGELAAGWVVAPVAILGWWWWCDGRRWTEGFNWAGVHGELPEAPPPVADEGVDRTQTGATDLSPAEPQSRGATRGRVLVAWAGSPHGLEHEGWIGRSVRAALNRRQQVLAGWGLEPRLSWTRWWCVAAVFWLMLHLLPAPVRTELGPWSFGLWCAGVLLTLRTAPFWGVGLRLFLPVSSVDRAVPLWGYLPVEMSELASLSGRVAAVRMAAALPLVVLAAGWWAPSFRAAIIWAVIVAAVLMTVLPAAFAARSGQCVSPNEHAVWRLGRILGAVVALLAWLAAAAVVGLAAWAEEWVPIGAVVAAAAALGLLPKVAAAVSERTWRRGKVDLLFPQR